jgi:chemotaxis signal transduction protein
MSDSPITKNSTFNMNDASRPLGDFGHISIPGYFSVDLPIEGDAGCVFFDCDHQRWGVRLSDIEQIVPAQAVQPVAVPQSPYWLLGAFQIDMKIGTLVDLNAFMSGSLTDVQALDELSVLVASHQRVLKVARLSHAAMLASEDLHIVIPQFRPSNQPYLLAKYTPQLIPNEEAAISEGILDLAEILKHISQVLYEGDIHE